MQTLVGGGASYSMRRTAWAGACSAPDVPQHPAASAHARRKQPAAGPGRACVPVQCSRSGGSARPVLCALEEPGPAAAAAVAAPHLRSRQRFRCR
jgi:hypothetical protein